MKQRGLAKHSVSSGLTAFTTVAAYPPGHPVTVVTVPVLNSAVGIWVSATQILIVFKSSKICKLIVIS